MHFQIAHLCSFIDGPYIQGDTVKLICCVQLCISSLISCDVVPVKDAQKCVLSSLASIITANNTAAMVGAITPHLMVKIVSRMVQNDTLECIQTPHREYFTLQRLLIKLFLATYSSLNPPTVPLLGRTKQTLVQINLIPAQSDSSSFDSVDGEVSDKAPTKEDLLIILIFMVYNLKKRTNKKSTGFFRNA